MPMNLRRGKSCEPIAIVGVSASGMTAGDTTMANDRLELNSGGVPVSTSFKMTPDDLRGIAEKTPDVRGINRQLELRLVGAPPK